MTSSSELTAPLRSSNATEVYSALIKIGKEDHRELEAEIVPFLDSVHAELRSAAIRVLGFYWNLPAYRERTAEMVRSERDPDARSVAIMAWSSYYGDTKNVDVLKTLHALTLDTTQRLPVRAAAYSGMMVVSGIPATVATGERGYQNHRRHRYPGTHPVERGRFFAAAVPRRRVHELSVALRS